MIKKVLGAVAILFMNSVHMNCTSPTNEGSEHVEKPLFELLSARETNIDFVNEIVEGLNTNVLMYEYFYNGAGVAAGDLNNDGLEDLYFTSNLGDNALYINRGDMRFEEVAQLAAVTGRPGPWKTGVTMADVNGDGRQDLYVCYSGKMAPQKLVNQLFINMGANEQGIPTFFEQTQQYGLAFPTNTTHAVFFDFDNDGDLDLFILNHHPDSLPKLNEEDTNNVLQIDDPVHGVRLLRNEGSFFTDITIEAGIISSPITYGLGAGVSDINLDGWADIYICNDFSLPDYLYINNGDGTFTDRLQEMLGHTSYASMGNNVADINNDGLPDIFSLDMLPEDNRRQKLLLAPNDYDFFDLNVRLGFYYQYLRSMLHINNGNNTFSEIGQIAGIAATDWSWTPLFADFDNDGWKDLLITNGYLRDYTNLDFLNRMDMFVQQNDKMDREDVLDLVNQMPETELYNYIYRNNGNATFTRSNESWGLNEGSYSNGSVYVDLDNDGDLDIVTNNINKPVFIYENKSRDLNANNYLKVRLNGNAKNKYGHGTKVYVYYNQSQQLLEQQPARGYQSSVSPVLHFGLGHTQLLDSVKVVWPGGACESLMNVTVNQTITFDQSAASSQHNYGKNSSAKFVERDPLVQFTHSNTDLNDFKRQPLMLNAKSFEGPCLIRGDVDNDGLEDVFIGGGVDQAGAIYLQKAGGFIFKSNPVFELDKGSDDVDATFADVNNDGHLDLYVCSGGYHDFLPSDARLQDRLYLNDGHGNFTKAPLPEMLTSTHAVASCDINQDGYEDFFVGGFVVPGRYPENPESYVLLNNKQGQFDNATSEVGPSLKNIGMVSDAEWHDLDGDQLKELVIAGQWMPVMVYGLKDGKLQETTSQYFDRSYSGFWNSILIEDLNNDKLPDLVAGNLGKNSQMQASFDKPADLYYKDFDNNGSIDPIISFFIGDQSYPYVTRKELITQLGRMEQRFPDFNSYADATINDVFTPQELEVVGTHTANHSSTSYFEMGSDGKFKLKELPIEAQYSPIYTINSLDYNDDGIKDLLLCGNINNARIRIGKYDANYGLLLEGDGKGGFTTIPQYKSGFKVKGDVRGVVTFDDLLLFAINGKEIVTYKKEDEIQ